MEMKSTVKGCDSFIVSSTIQKAIRRNEPKLAGYVAPEVYHYGYPQYFWKHLLTVSAEDCYGYPITTEICNLHRSFKLINDSRPDLNKGRIFKSKAVIVLCRTPKCRDAGHSGN